ncbi:MAG: hypothetical protein R2755_26200 [Acidimicrobiales bacterium]
MAVWSSPRRSRVACSQSVMAGDDLVGDDGGAGIEADLPAL